MWFIGLALAVVGALIAFASDWLIEKSPWEPADNAVRWLKPFARTMLVFGLGIVVGGW